MHLLHCTDGMIPSDMATGSPEEVEEERRLFYVALTRARDSLHLHAPLRYYHHPRATDRHSYAQLSRFLTEDSLACLDRTNAAGKLTSASDDEVRAGPVGGTDAVDEFLESLWAAP